LGPFDAGLYGEAEARNRRAVEFRSYDRLIDVFATSESGGVSNKVVAKVRTILYIEDLGPADETAVPLQPKATVASQALTHEPEPSRAPETQSHPSLDEAKLKRDLEHDIRSELEREMEEVFKKRLEEVRFLGDVAQRDFRYDKVTCCVWYSWRSSGLPKRPSGRKSSTS